LSLNDAKAYCEFIGARVPFEASGNMPHAPGPPHHYWGEEVDGRYLWYFNNTDERPMPVGANSPMHGDSADVEGNAMEWVRDGGPHSSITRQGAGSVAADPTLRALNRIRRWTACGSVPWSRPTFPSFENSNFRPDERRFDYGVRCAK
jgi:hypothetical protein